MSTYCITTEFIALNQNKSNTSIVYQQSIVMSMHMHVCMHACASVVAGIMQRIQQSDFLYKFFFFLGALSKSFKHKVKPYFQSAFKILQIGCSGEEEKKVTKGVKSWNYPPSDVCGRMWWSVWGWACLWGSASEESRSWVWDSRTLGGSDIDVASLATSAG